MLGVSHDDYRRYKAFNRAQAHRRPAAYPKAGLETLAIVSLVFSALSVGFTVVASFLKPKPGKASSLNVRQRQGGSFSSNSSYQPESGIESVQNVTTLGSVVPLVYTLSEVIDGVRYGAVQVNTPVLWSQILTLPGGLLYRAQFLIAAANIGGIDPRGIAIGGNTLRGYDLGSTAATEAAARFTAYANYSGGRISSSHRIAGRTAANDPGNSQVSLSGQTDVLSLRSTGNAWRQDFCSASRPANQVVFGLYSPIGNNKMLRINPSVRSMYNPQLIPEGDKGKSKVTCQKDFAIAAQRLKYRAEFSTRSGFTAGSAAAVGNILTYTLDKSSDIETLFGDTISGLSWQTDIVQIQSGESVDFGPTTLSGAPALSVRTRYGVGSTITNYSSRWSRGSITVSGSGDNLTLSTTLTFNTTGLTTAELISLSELSWQVRFTNDNVDDDKEPSTIIKLTVNKDTQVGTIYSGATQNPTTYALIQAGSFNYNPTPNETCSVTNTVQTVSVKFDSDGAFFEPATDVAQNVAGKQRTWDEAIVVGDRYRCGSAELICSSKSPSNQRFRSNSEDFPVNTSSGQTITATFTVVEPGIIQTHSLSTLQTNGSSSASRTTDTTYPQLYRMAVASYNTTRPARIIEIGFKATLGIVVSNLMNYRDTLTFAQADSRGCIRYRGNVLASGAVLNTDQFTSGVASFQEERYAFFKLGYRELGTDDAFTMLTPCFGMRGANQQATYGFVRLELPTVKLYEFVNKPISGWEIRSGTASGDLIILDSRIVNPGSFTSGSVTGYYNGEVVSRVKATFSIRASTRDTDIGIGFSDGDSYLDAWGKLAIDFPYDEARSSAASGPEFEVWHINEIVENPTIPLYNKLATWALNIRSTLELPQVGQASVRVIAGQVCKRYLNGDTLGSSHLLPDVARDILLNPDYGKGDVMIPELISNADFYDTAVWCYNRRYFFDGTFAEPTNIRSWLAEAAGGALCYYAEINSKVVIRPLIQFTPITIKAVLSLGTIDEQLDSFTTESSDVEDRLTVQVSVRYREERASTNPTNPGLFPVFREVLVREAAPYGSETDEVRSVDLSEWCTSRAQAIDVGKYTARVQRIGTDTAAVRTTIDAFDVPVAPGDYIRVPIETVFFDEYNTGLVTASGKLNSLKTLADGNYTISAWRASTSTSPTIETMTVTGGGLYATPTGILYTVQETGKVEPVFQVSRIDPLDNGGYSLEIVSTPVDADRRLLISLDWDNPASWVIQ
jgi:hypothetical protein